MFPVHPSLTGVNDITRMDNKMRIILHHFPHNRLVHISLVLRVAVKRKHHGLPFGRSCTERTFALLPTGHYFVFVFFPGFQAFKPQAVEDVL